MTRRGLAGDLLAMRAKRAVLEVKANLQGAGSGHGPHIAHGTLEDPAKAGNGLGDSARERTVAKTGTYHASKLNGSPRV